VPEDEKFIGKEDVSLDVECRSGARQRSASHNGFRLSKPGKGGKHLCNFYQRAAR
jgi:hypothetical protein